MSDHLAIVRAESVHKGERRNRAIAAARRAGFSTAEIAQATSLSIASVQSIVRRLRGPKEVAHKDLHMEVRPSGALVIMAWVGDQFVTRKYMGLTRQAAAKRFYHEVNPS